MQPSPVNSAPPGNDGFPGHDGLFPGELPRLLGKKLIDGLKLMHIYQHPSGEIISFRRQQIGYVYCRSPFVSAIVHEALSCFDPTSAGWLNSCLGILLPEHTKAVFKYVGAIRQRIRAFLLWQKEAQGWWRFFGRGSGIDPDISTTMVALLALRDAPGIDSYRYWDEHIETVRQFRSSDGLYYTFYRPGRGGYGWMDEKGRPIVGYDRVVNADVVWFLSEFGLEVTEADPVFAYLLGECEDKDLTQGTSLFPNPVSYFYAISRLLCWDKNPYRDRFEKSILSRLLSMQQPTGEFGGPLSTVLAAHTLINLQYTGEELDRARFAVLRSMQGSGGWQYEDFIVSGFGSPALTTALSLSFLVHYEHLKETVIL